MTQKELTELNIGENLDARANLDPRGYGVCRILYAGAREYTGEPMTMHAAKLLCNTLKEGDLVYLMTGFVLLDNKAAETDGIVSTMLLARALVLAFNVKPVVICQEENLEAVKNIGRVIGLHLYFTMEDLKANPVSKPRRRRMRCLKRGSLRRSLPTNSPVKTASANSTMPLANAPRRWKQRQTFCLKNYSRRAC